MARRKVIHPNWSVSKEMAQNREELETNFSALTVGELVINTTSGITSLATLDDTDTPVIFESSAMIDKRLENFLDNVHKHTNKEVLDGITSGMVESWNNAEANAVSSSKTYTDNQINFVLCGATEAFDTLKEVEEWVESHSGETINIIKGINSLSGNVSALTQYILDNERTISEALNQLNDSAGFNANGESILPKKMDLSTAILTISGIVVSLKNISHTHENKEVLDSITSDKITQWDAAEPNVITEISAVTKDNSNVISVNGKKVTIDLTNVGDENVIETIKVNNSALTVSNKTVNVDLSYLEQMINNIELTPGPKGDDGITPVFTAITANVNNATGVPYVSVTSAKTDGEKYALTFDFQNLKGEKGDRGDDGTSVKILGTKQSYDELPSSNNVNGDGYIIGENLYVWNGSTWVDVGQIKGPQGDPGTNAYISAVTASVGNTTGVPSVKVTTGGTHSEMSIDFDFDNLKGVKGDEGRSITSIDRTEGNGAAGTTDVYTITYSDETTSTFNVYNGENGINGNNGITPVFTAVTANVNNATGTPQVSVVTAKTADEKYSMEFSFQNMKGDKGDKGDDGTSVKILGTKQSYDELPSSNNVNGDGYIIGENLYVWNGSTWVDVGQIKGPQGDPGTNAYISAVTASVGNTTGTPSVDVTTAGTPSNISFNLAFNGLKGSSGNDGIGIKSFVRTNGNGAAGSTDTYTITFTNGETSAITVYNGSDGKDGASGAAGTNGSTWYNGITEPSTGTGVDGDWYINTSTWNVYHKESNSWAIKGNIKGETGSFDDSALSSYALKSEIPDISGKVDKVDGKGLSTNDFTNDLKNKLNGIAAGAEVNVQSDWNATSGDALILNKPSLATVATSGSYNDLNDTPTIPDISGIQSKLNGIAEGAEVNVQSDWNETTTTSDAYIKNKPTLATVATSGNYNDLTNTPRIPSVDGFIKNISLDTSTETLYIVGSTSKIGSTASLNTSSTDIYMQGGEIYAASDETLKNFGEDIEVDFDKLAEIPKVYYTWKTDVDNKQQIGTSAQKLREIYPELVSESEDGKLAVSYEKLSVIALSAVDKLHKENEELKERLRKIEEKLGL